LFQPEARYRGLSLNRSASGFDVLQASLHYPGRINLSVVRTECPEHKVIEP
jgi:hypothetical protein